MRKKLTSEDLKAWFDFLKGIKPEDSQHPAPPQENIRPQNKSQPKVTPAPLSLQRKDFRNIKIQATLDLHGLSIADGRGAFEAFIKRSFNRGHKYLLVITGKGAIHSSQTLRRNLPLWLQDQPLRGLVISYANPVKPEHGGAGAFYIVLRKKKKI